MRVVGCFVEFEDKLLVLLRHPEHNQGNRWGLPAGRVKEGESDLEAMRRVLKEETGIEGVELEFVADFPFPELNIDFPTFRVRFTEKPEIKINLSSHLEYMWITHQEYYDRKDVVHGIHDLLERANYIKK